MHGAGLRQDLPRLIEHTATRRQLLGWLMTSVAPVLGCDGAAPTRSVHDASTESGSLAPGVTPLGDAAAARDGALLDASEQSTSCLATPAETGGPFPADSRIGPNVLLQSGIVRSDIRSSFALGTATAGGVQLSITLKVIDSESCRPVQGAVVYLWHCDREGRYSLYSPGVTEQDYLRGAQQTDRNGNVTFQTIFPGCYPGRWPHMHFEVFANVAAATSAGATPLLTSQLAFLESDCQAAYSAAGYEASVDNLQLLSLQTDGVFRDGFEQQLATVTGAPALGLLATFTVTT